MSEKTGEMHLVACEPLTSHGFALPLFGQRSRANTLYIASCDPPGDHSGRISGFDVYEPSHHLWLPESLQLTAAVGGPWLDVFLRGEPFAAGRPADIWAALKQVLDEAAAETPLSLLDAAINAAAPERDQLANAARTFIVNRFGEDRARRWATLLSLRSLEVELMHAAAGDRLLDLKSCNVAADPTAGVIVATLPAQRPAAFSALLEPVLANAALLAEALEVELQRQVPEEASIDVLSPLPTSDDENFADAVDSLPPAATGMLILAIGGRARAIVRYLDMPGWHPEDIQAVEKDGDLRIDGRLHATGMPFPVEVVTATGMDRIRELSGQYDVIVVLAGDADRKNEQFASRVQDVVSAAARPGAMVLFAPAIPEQAPTSAMFDASRGRLPQFHALLDTSQARSPFWWGSARRSLDRRAADIVMGGAVLAMVPEVRQALADREGEAPVVLAFALVPTGTTAPREEIMLASESTWVRRSPERMLFSRQIALRGRSQAAAGRVALVEGRAPQLAFEEFAREALGEIVREPGSDHRPLEAAPWGDPKLWLAEGPSASLGLASPEHAVALTLAGPPRSLRLIVSAEAPTLASVTAARAAGQLLVRYTDKETLAPLLTSAVDSPVVPAELRLASLRSASPNRRLATRGVDQRDVVRLTEDQLQEWLASAAQAQQTTLMERLRTVRSTGSTRTVSPEHVLRRKDVLTSERDADGSIVRLQKLLRLENRELAASYKRQADLEISWTSSPPGRKRFAILDGELPPVVLRLETGEVVMQAAFIVDGDEGVPALFRSRAFAVWGRATLSRSNSWMSRFSVGTTFAGFPLPRGFKILEESGRAVLDSSEAGPELIRLAIAVETVIERELARSPQTSWKLAHRVGDSGPMREINALILKFYELPPDADDLALLVRLSELNAQL
jgi:hypothetical protein